MELTELKEGLIFKVKQYYSDRVIYPTHSLVNQINAALAGGDTDMKTFIDSKRTDIDGLETDINALADTLILDNFSLTDDEATRKSYVAGYLASCDTDEKQLMCVLALQDIKISG